LPGLFPSELAYGSGVEKPRPSALDGVRLDRRRSRRVELARESRVAPPGGVPAYGRQFQFPAVGNLPAPDYPRQAQLREL
jgi:hypothetical protein